MLASLMKLAASLIDFDLRGRLRALTITAVLALLALVALLVACGFGLSLLYVWLQQMLGTMPALAIIAGGSALLALILLALAFARPGRRAPPRRASPRGAPNGASTDRLIEDALAALQQGSRESMLAAVALAVVAGVILARKL